MRVLVTALVPSHIVPMVPLTWALRAAGHQVLVAGDAELVKFAAAAGLDTRLVGGGETRQRLTRPGAVAMPDRAGMDRRADSEWDAVGERWRTRLGGYIDDLVTLGRAWEPDLVVTDPVEFGGLVVAAALGVPGVIHRWGPDDFTSPLLRQAKVQLHDLCAEFGADGFPIRPSSSTRARPRCSPRATTPRACSRGTSRTAAPPNCPTGRSSGRSGRGPCCAWACGTAGCSPRRANCRWASGTSWTPAPIRAWTCCSRSTPSTTPRSPGSRPP